MHICYILDLQWIKTPHPEWQIVLTIIIIITVIISILNSIITIYGYMEVMDICGMVSDRK
jgi:hypothetical protein